MHLDGQGRRHAGCACWPATQYDAVMTHDELQQVDVIIQRLNCQTMRSMDQDSAPPSIIDRPWFPWVAMPCAIAIGVGLALTAG